MRKKEKNLNLRNVIIIMILDSLVVAFSSMFALYARFDFSFNEIPSAFINGWVSFLPIEIVVTLVLFYVLGMYNYVWRYVNINDVLKMGMSVVATEFLVLILKIILHYQISRIAIALTFLLNLFLFVAMRCTLRVYGIFNNRESENDDRIMIIGAGDAGNILIHEIQGNRAKFGKVVCAIDDNPNKKKKYIAGVPIVGNRDNIIEAVKKYRVNQIIIAIPTAKKENKKALLDICAKTNAKVKILPSLFQLYSGQVSVNEVKDVEIEDILGRDPIKLDQDVVRDFIQNKVVLITGGGGSIGSEIARQVALNHPKRLVLVDNYENNVYEIQQELKRKYGAELSLDVIIATIRDKERIEEIFRNERPEIVLHAAAHKHVPLMEDAPSEAIKNNIFGTYHVVRACEKYGVKKFIMISTDKAVNPTSVMGATKRFCEMILQSRAIYAKSHPEIVTEFASVRFGNVLGSNGSVVPLFKKQIEQGGPVTITDKRINRFFMTIPEATELVLEAGAIATQNQIFVLDMGEPVKIIDLAENMIRLSGLEPYKDIEIKEIGLRPGEKLYEELLMKSEHLIKTENKKIFIEEQSNLDPDLVMSYLKKFDEAVTREASNEELKELIKEIIPTYTGDNI